MLTLTTAVICQPLRCVPGIARAGCSAGQDVSRDAEGVVRKRADLDREEPSERPSVLVDQRNPGFVIHPPRLVRGTPPPAKPSEHLVAMYLAVRGRLRRCPGRPAGLLGDFRLDQAHRTGRRHQPRPRRPAVCMSREGSSTVADGEQLTIHL